jgi:solute carrier family 6 amino acid/orphan transporter-like 15/16/17/18/20
MEKLLQPKVWLEAANQVFFAYGLAFGSIISFGSFNAPKTNCVRDVFVLSACNAFTAVYACAVIFAILGFKAHHLFEKCMDRYDYKTYKQFELIKSNTCCISGMFH